MPEARLARTRALYGPGVHTDHDDLLALMRERSFVPAIPLVPGLTLRSDDGREWLVGDDYLARRIYRTPAWRAPHLNAAEQLHRNADVRDPFSQHRDLGDEHGA
jgi:hypothetical protein